MASRPLQLDNAARWVARNRQAAGETRITTVGWLLDTTSAAFIWSPPRRVMRERPDHRHAKSLTQCPAIVDADARLFEILSPVDVHIGFKLDESQRPVLINLAGDQSPIRGKHLNQMVTIVNRREWSNPSRPVIQFITPFVFVADEPVYLNQLPPYNHYRRDALPGLMVPGRLPIDIWPRHLMWAFEWHEPDKPLVLRRGEPWWYARFESTDPARPVRLIEAQMTPELREYMQGISSVTNYVGQTYSLFATARARRPSRLLVEKVRG
jgi:hypothetical protein